MSTSILRLHGVRKSFGGIHALKGVDLALYPGEVTALIGENGAGKSTLVKILTGIYQVDAGEIWLEGHKTDLSSKNQTNKNEIGAIHQEAVVFDDLTVAENVLIINRPQRYGMVDWKTLYVRAQEIIHELDPSIDVRMPMRQLSVAQKHIVQIARALSNQARIVIMDEPTAALSHREVEELFAIVKKLKEAGQAILFISHKFEEIYAIADRYAVFRDGESIGEGMVADVNRDQLIAMMVGRSVDQIFPKENTLINEEMLEIKDLSYAQEFENINFSLRKGEVLGVYGLVGAGRSEVMQAIAGLTKPDKGSITLQGKLLDIKTPADAIEAGISYVPEDRQKQGGILSFSIAKNISLPSLSHLSHRGFIKKSDEQNLAMDYIKQLQIKTAGPDQRMDQLSGGNQQKVVIGKWLSTQPSVLILDEPTKGIDVGAKTAVYRLIDEMASQGLGIIMVSSELPEVLGMADRIMVMRRGRQCAMFNRSDATAEAIVKAATDA